MKTFIAGLILGIVLMLQVHAQRVTTLTFAQLQDKLSRKNDTVYVYNFWATWCAPCVKELPHFEALGDSFREQKVKVILVSLDFPENLEDRVLPFVKKKNLQSEVWLLTDVHDPELSGVWIDQVSPQWSGSIPATLLTWGTKDMYSFKEQEFTYDALSGWISAVLSGQ